jgi:hypothetical protein
MVSRIIYKLDEVTVRKLKDVMTILHLYLQAKETRYQEIKKIW